MVGEVSHDRNEESLEAKARWFQSLTMEQRMQVFAEYYDLAVTVNPELVKRDDVPAWATRVQILELKDVPEK